jgi:hypothetical protein
LFKEKKNKKKKNGGKYIEKHFLLKLCQNELMNFFQQNYFLEVIKSKIKGKRKDRRENN